MIGGLPDAARENERFGQTAERHRKAIAVLLEARQVELRALFPEGATWDEADAWLTEHAREDYQAWRHYYPGGSVTNPVALLQLVVGPR